MQLIATIISKVIELVPVWVIYQTASILSSTATTYPWHQLAICNDGIWVIGWIKGGWVGPSLPPEGQHQRCGTLADRGLPNSMAEVGFWNQPGRTKSMKVPALTLMWPSGSLGETSSPLHQSGSAGAPFWTPGIRLWAYRRQWVQFHLFVVNVLHSRQQKSFA